eukprot:s6638_g5.t1
MLQIMFGCASAQDVRDHLNELAELATRASGFMGTGFAAEEKVENMDEHAKQASEVYDKTLGVKHARSSGVERGQLLDPICVIPRMLEKHPDFKPKIEQTVGHGLAILRQKHKFKFGSMHRYFY